MSSSSSSSNVIREEVIEHITTPNAFTTLPEQTIDSLGETQITPEQREWLKSMGLSGTTSVSDGDLKAALGYIHIAPEFYNVFDKCTSFDEWRDPNRWLSRYYLARDDIKAECMPYRPAKPPSGGNILDPERLKRLSAAEVRNLNTTLGLMTTENVLAKGELLTFIPVTHLFDISTKPIASGSDGGDKSLASRLYRVVPEPHVDESSAPLSNNPIINYSQRTYASLACLMTLHNSPLGVLVNQFSDEGVLTSSGLEQQYKVLNTGIHQKEKDDNKIVLALLCSQFAHNPDTHIDATNPYMPALIDGPRLLGAYGNAAYFSPVFKQLMDAFFSDATVIVDEQGVRQRWPMPVSDDVGAAGILSAAAKKALVIQRMPNNDDWDALILNYAIIRATSSNASVERDATLNAFCLKSTRPIDKHQPILVMPSLDALLRVQCAIRSIPHVAFIESLRARLGNDRYNVDVLTPAITKLVLRATLHTTTIASEEDAVINVRV